jgi:hypothetical protein
MIAGRSVMTTPLIGGAGCRLIAGISFMLAVVSTKSSARECDYEPT